MTDMAMNGTFLNNEITLENNHVIN